MIYGQLIFMARLLEPNETGGGSISSNQANDWEQLFVHNPS